MTIPADTIQIDSTVLGNLRANPAYDYSRELSGVRSGLTDWLKERISRYIGSFFQGIGNGDDTSIYVTFAVIAVIIIVVIVAVTKPKIFFRKSKDITEEENNVDNIYGVDFDAEIAAARRKGNWSQAVRFIYLQTLRLLSDKKLIAWRPSKTPTQYTYEFEADDFRQMTRIFLRVRYGGYSADEAMADTMARLQAAIASRVNADKEAEQQQGSPKTKKGGDA